MLNFAQRINEVILLIKRSVFKLSNHGFLLVEHLIALSITALLVLLITQLLPLINFYQADLNQVTQQEISVLRTQLQKEAKRANHFSNTSSQFQIHLANRPNLLHLQSSSHASSGRKRRRSRSLSL